MEPGSLPMCCEDTFKGSRLEDPGQVSPHLRTRSHPLGRECEEPGGLRGAAEGRCLGAGGGPRGQARSAGPCWHRLELRFEETPAAGELGAPAPGLRAGWDGGGLAAEPQTLDAHSGRGEVALWKSLLAGRDHQPRRKGRGAGFSFYE